MVRPGISVVSGNGNGSPCFGQFAEVRFDGQLEQRPQLITRDREGDTTLNVRRERAKALWSGFN